MEARDVKTSRLAAVSLVAVPLVAFSYVNANDEAGGRFVFDTVRRGAIASAIEATGTVEAVETVDVGSEVSGLIAKVFVNFNDPVAAGQPIAELDRAGFAARVAEARAALKVSRALADVQRSALRRAQIAIATAQAERKTAEAQAKAAEARRDEAEKELARKLQLTRSGAATDRELSQARTARDASEAELRAALDHVEARADAIEMAHADAEMARANIANADAAADEKQAALDEAEVALGRTIVRAPIDGVVISREVNPGQAVAAGLETKTLFRIAHDLGEMQVHGSIDEADIGLVKDGDAAEFTVDAYPGQVFEGRVAQVRKAPSTVQNVVTYAAIVSAPNPQRLLFPGMTAALKIVTEEAKGVLTVPNRALHFAPQNAAALPVAARPAAVAKRGAVWTEGAEGRLIPVDIETGASDDNRTEVIAGDLREGEPVIVGLAKSKGQP
jgi:HlyD family secretion protein